MGELLFWDEVYRIVGAGMAVYNELGSGFLEAVYQEAMGLELLDREIPFVAQTPLTIRYRQHTLSKRYIADFVCFGAVLVELKCSAAIVPADEAQVINYLKATGLRVAIILNFDIKDELEWRRYVL